MWEDNVENNKNNLRDLEFFWPADRSRTKLSRYPCKETTLQLLKS